ncbi:MAG: RsmB/NOP family class I SAM-dependent RNA methyltransferase [Nevskiaceae bacterium]
MSAGTIGSGRARTVRHTHLKLAATALTRVIDGEPADHVLRELFASQRSAGSRDRATITGLVYGVLRDYFPLRVALGSAASPLELCAAHALRSMPLTPESLPALDGLDAHALAQRLAQPAPPDEAARHNLPQWLWQALRAQYGDQASALARALNAEASVDLRVNTLKAKREEAQRVLREDGIESDPIEGVEEGLRLRKREALQRTRAFRDGWVEPQDAGSQRLAAFVHATPGETVVDFCAGAGGKTLALGAAMRNRGRLLAFDISRERLSRLGPRLARSGLTIVESHALSHERDARLQPLLGSCDAVLVDVPCSATGTLRRNPELRLREADLAHLAATQGLILEGAARLVRTGGRLIYATCSVLSAENEEIAAAFLTYFPDFEPDGELILLPHRDGTDGFYAIRLIRRSSSSAPRPTPSGT